MAPHALLEILLALALLHMATCNARDDGLLDTVGLLRKYGYAGEVHNVTTDDGYVLQLHRASPQRVRRSAQAARIPVLLQHGLLSSSADWVVTGPGHALAYILADAGYDVWMGNARGNFYSRQHVRLQPDEPAFWDFSWHEVGVLDLPAMIDYVLAATGSDRLAYVGHSMGTTAFFVMAALRPEYNAKVGAMFALAPVVHFAHMQSLGLRVVALANKPIAALMRLAGAHEVMPNSRLQRLSARALCAEDSLLASACRRVARWITNYDGEIINMARLHVILGHSPAGVSTRCLQHFAQIIVANKFRQYDYGRDKNLEEYGKPEPPSYDLDKISVPVFLYWSAHDPLTNMKDVETLQGDLPNCRGMFEVSYEKFNHLDFIFSDDAKKYVYDQVIEQIDAYSLDSVLDSSSPNLTDNNLPS